jgi:hypothetical protein
LTVALGMPYGSSERQPQLQVPAVRLLRAASHDPVSCPPQQRLLRVTPARGADQSSASFSQLRPS